jgi:hypothetical protein
MPLGSALVTRDGMLAILGVCEPSSAAGAEVVKLASHRRRRLGGPRRRALGQLAQLGEHPLSRGARGGVTGVEVAGVLVPDLHQAALTLLKISRQLAHLPVVGDQRSPARRARADEVGLIESGLVSCGESGLLGELVEGVLVVAGGGAQGAGGGWVGIGELGQAGLE